MEPHNVSCLFELVFYSSVKNKYSIVTKCSVLLGVPISNQTQEE